MTTRQLLWGAMWRGAAWGCRQAALFGALFGVVIGILYVIAGFPDFLSNDHTLLMDIVSVSIVALSSMLLGFFVGGIIGIISGLILGLIGGFMLGVLSRLFFFPLRDTQRYRKIISIISTTFGFVGTMILLEIFSVKFLFPNIGIFVFLNLIPSFFAGLIAFETGKRLVSWYENEIMKEKQNA